MNMVVLPIVDRELRVASRKRSVYRDRLTLARIATLASFFFLFAGIATGTVPGESARMSQSLFTFLANLIFVYCIFAGIWATSDCLAEERRNETLGLLFLTKLRGIDVVLGKLVASSLQAVSGVIGVFPVLALPLILGGVGFAEFWRVLLVLLLTLMGSLSLGIVISSMSRNAVRAGVGVALGLLGLCLAGPIASGLFMRLLGVGPGFEGGLETVQWMMFYSSPLHALYASYDAHHLSREAAYWTFVGLWIFFTAVFLMVACLVTSRIWRETWTRKAHSAPGIDPVTQGGTDRSHRSGIGEWNPIHWRLTRKPSKPVWVFASLGIVAMYWFFLGRAVSDKVDMFSQENCLFTAFVMQLIVKLWVGVEASSRFGDERRSGALEVLLSTPIKIPEILDGHRKAMAWQFFWPIVFVIVIELALFATWLSTHWAGEIGSWGMMYFGSMLLFIVDLQALSWLGMWRGLTSRFVNRTAMAVLQTVLLWPWIGFILFWVGLQFSSRKGNAPFLFGSTEASLLLGAWFVIGAVSSVYWWWFGRNRLRNELRHVASLPVGLSRPRESTTEV